MTMNKILYGWLFGTLLFFIYCCKSNSYVVSNLIDGQWEYVVSEDGSKPVNRHEAGFIGLDEKFYLLGGRGMKPVSIYDTKSNTWEDGAVPPVEMHHFQPVVYKNEIYALGAMTGGYPGETPVSHIYIYSPAKDVWRQGAAIPEERQRGGAGAVVYGDKIFLVCGIRDGHRGDHKKWLDTYDLKSGQWTALNDAPRPRDHFQAVVIDHKLYAVAGRTTIAAENPFKNTIGEVDIYDLKTNRWSTLPDHLPTHRAGGAAMSMHNDVIVFGGESFSQEVAHSEMEALNTSDNSWRSLPAMIRGRHGTGAIFFQNQIYMASGCGNRGGNPELDDLIRFSF